MRDDYARVRAATEALVAGLPAEDLVVQSMPDASPAKWHLAHTTWFFETFVLRPAGGGYRPFHPEFEVLFNSYYEAVGPQFSRPRRGLLSRPTGAEVLQYRAHVDAAMHELLAQDGPPWLGERVRLGLEHEQQHQELILMDLLHLYAQNPLRPALRASAAPPSSRPAPSLRWCLGPVGVREVGHAGAGFHFDNEGPRHQTLLRPYVLASRCVTNAEYAEFVADGGYRRSTLWLSDGWAQVQAEGWTAPLYWYLSEGTWWQTTLGGPRPLDPHAPVVHVSHYEADAFARWAGARLPTEFEWEALAEAAPVRGNFVESGRLHPTAAEPPPRPESQPAQLFGDVWEWTASAYLPYPGYHPPEGALGEYNGKFMSNQMVLRGGSCASPRDHLRASYRNFFPPRARWPFTGIRLTKDA
ncbi:ergothioneine biosynthesis protein EgtB [Nannocystis exedens]|uniref:Ergothioneine biosynthesis protein EgtB n=1 Tax=Nannocystis exedens TaxID=54 RepID=A0A1I1VRR3_9BACT|nr:ergothioneine biosynthesis protein EgtB [Nannocystis exedens]PCC72790.1 Iron(II)-dependent oxidoreductase EgtB [Nannocystis exedens]SFD85782.1 ergothioneine biosynthesis protein EgtB [Nannocystis exedens]